jgi:hypothetical protein
MMRGFRRHLLSSPSHAANYLALGLGGFSGVWQLYANSGRVKAEQVNFYIS